MVQIYKIQPYLLTKVIHGKVVEEFEHVDVHCFTTCKISIKMVKYKVMLSHLVQNNFLSRPCTLGHILPKAVSSIKFQNFLLKLYTEAYCAH